MSEETDIRTDDPSAGREPFIGGKGAARAEPASSGGASQPLSSVVLLLIVAGLLWVVALVLPDRGGLVGRVGTLTHWVSFGKFVLGDTLKAGALVSLALAVSAVAPGIGLWMRRMAFQTERRLFLAVMAGLSVLSAALFSYFVLDHLPRIQDEVAMHFQAKILASGRLYAPAPELIDFFDCEFVVADGPRWYGKYFAGSSLLMVPGMWLGVPWLISPILSGVAVLLVYAIGRSLFNEGVARVAALLMLISPFRISLFSMMMAHPACMVALGVFTLAVIRVIQHLSGFQLPGSDSRFTTGDGRLPITAVKQHRNADLGWAATAGAALGFAVHCRPLTAAAIGAVLGLAAMWFMPWRQLRWKTVAAFALPLGVFAVLFLGYNHALTGDPLLTPFNRFSPGDRLGFGPDVGIEYAKPYDRGHSWHKAVFMNTYFNIDALGTNLLGWGQVALLLLAWPVVRSRWPGRARLLAAVIGALVFAYFFYHAPSVFAGQARYWSEAMPMMILLVALALVNAREWLPAVARALGLLRPARTGSAACWLAGALLTVWGVAYVHIPLINECQHFHWGRVSSLRDEVRQANLTNALVFLESGHYRHKTGDEKWDVYASGFVFNDPDLQGPVVFARDLGDERNAELIARYPGRELYWIDLTLFDQARLIPLLEATERKE
jgi:hypothetical protein